MIVHLQIGNSQFAIGVQEAAKIMEMLNKATAIDNHYLDNESGYHEQLERYYSRVSITQFDGQILTNEQYIVAREAYDAKRKQED